MDPITIAAISVLGLTTLLGIFQTIFYIFNTYQQTQAQKSIAKSTKEGLEIQRDGVSVQKEIAQNTSHLSSHLQNNQPASEMTPSNNNKPSQSKSSERDKLKIIPKVIPFRLFV